MIHRVMSQGVCLRAGGVSFLLSDAQDPVHYANKFQYHSPPPPHLWHGFTSLMSTFQDGFTFDMEGPLMPVVFIHCDSMLLLQSTYFPQEVLGNESVRVWYVAWDTLSTVKTISLNGKQRQGRVRQEPWRTWLFNIKFFFFADISH